MWNDALPKRPVVGEKDALEEMDVRLSLAEYREFLKHEDQAHVAKLLGGDYSLEPWVRVRMGETWILTAGIEVIPVEDGA
jgi:hypothetical protein